MSKKKGDNEKHPYMYIVQPDISPPTANMQKYFRLKVDEEQPEGQENNDGFVLDEIQIIESEIIDAGNETAVEEVQDVDSAVADMEVVEVSTGIEDVSEENHEAKNSVDEEQRELSNKRAKVQKFSEMTKEELLNYLVKLPLAVPKPTCQIVIGGEELIGQVLKKKENFYVIKFIWENNSKTLNVPYDEIEDISVEYL